MLLIAGPRELDERCLLHDKNATISESKYTNVYYNSSTISETILEHI